MVKKASRPRKKRIVREKNMSNETDKEIKPIIEAKSEEAKKSELFPDRKPILGGNEYIPSDATKLVRDGKPWIPEEHGYKARLLSPEQIKVMGMRGYEPVPVEAGIRFAEHPLFKQEMDGEGGKAVHYRPKEIKEMDDELAKITGGNSKFVKLCSSILGLIPIEVSDARRKFAVELSNNALKNSLVQADEEAQEELGSNVRMVGKFSVGRNAQRSEVDRVKKSTKKVWAVSANIK